jgi:hypothetical protein
VIIENLKKGFIRRSLFIDKYLLMFSPFCFDVYVLQGIVYNTYAEMSIIIRTGSCII